MTEKATPSMFALPSDGTHLQSNLAFQGTMEIKGEESFVIHGTFDGLIIAKAGKVYVGPTGVFRGSIEAAHVTVAGTIESSKNDDSITATEVLAITETGQLSSPMISYGQIAMELGAVLHGQIKPSNPRQARSAEPLPVAERPRLDNGRLVSIDSRSASPLPAFLRPATPAMAPETEPTVALQNSESSISDGSDDAGLADAPSYGRTGTHDGDALTPIGD